MLVVCDSVVGRRQPGELDGECPAAQQEAEGKRDKCIWRTYHDLI